MSASEALHRGDVLAHRFVFRHALVAEPGVVLKPADEVERAWPLVRRVAVPGLAEQAVELELQLVGRLRRPRSAAT